MYAARVRQSPALDVVFGALADGTRRTICEVLHLEGEQTVTALVARFRVSQPAVSRHLRVLRDAGLVSADSRGRTRCYRLHQEAFGPAHAWLVLHGFWADRLDALAATLGQASLENTTPPTDARRSP